MYRCRGYILIEGSGTEAEYDVDVEEKYEGIAPTEMEVLDWMLNTGILQIVSESIEASDPEDEESA